MKLALCFGMAVGASLVFWLLLLVLHALFQISEGVSQTLFGVASGLFCTAIPYTHQWIERRTGGDSKVLVSPKHAVTLEGYTLPWYLPVVYGSLMLAGLWEGSGFLGGLAGGFIAKGLAPEFASSLKLVDANSQQTLLLGMVTSDALTAAVILFIFFLPFCLFLIGSWIGARTDEYGPLIAIGTVAAGTFVVMLMDLMLIALFPGIYGDVGGAILASFLGKLVLFVPFAVVAVIGYWRGRRARLSRYMGWLLRKLPEPSQHWVINIAFEEAQRWLAHQQGQSLQVASVQQLQLPAQPQPQLQMQFQPQPQPQLQVQSPPLTQAQAPAQGPARVQPPATTSAPPPPTPPAPRPQPGYAPQPIQSVQPSAPLRPSTPTQPAQPAPSTQPIPSTQPMPAKPPVQPVPSAQPVQPARPTPSTAPGQPPRRTPPPPPRISRPAGATPSSQASPQPGQGGSPAPQTGP